MTDENLGWVHDEHRSHDAPGNARQRTQARGVDMAQLVNELLKKDIELIEAAR
jgi:hypothetical protein